MELKTKITDKRAVIGIVGLGYVGLPLAVEFAGKGFRTIGIDYDAVKIEKLRRGENYIDDVSDEKLQACVKSEKLVVQSGYENADQIDVFYICVPTPFTRNKEPDVSFIRDAASAISKHLRRGQLVILKSTTFPETTEKEVLPVLQKSGLKVGEDFYLAFSPERIDPGNQKFTTENTPVIVGGVTERCTDMGVCANEAIIAEVVRVTNPRVAELAKLLENIFRSVNIALVNELAMLCDRMGGIDIWEVVRAAATKPFGFMPFYPGPGIGGHCILIDPYYLSWKAREFDFHTKFIELAAEVNENMPYYVYSMIIEALSNSGARLKDARILVLGAAFKKNVDDTRHSPSLKVMEILMSKGIPNVMYNDPHVAEVYLENGQKFSSVELTRELLSSVDCVFIGTDHDAYDYQFIVDHSKMVVDARNATARLDHKQNTVLTLGVGDNIAKNN